MNTPNLRCVCLFLAWASALGGCAETQKLVVIEPLGPLDTAVRAPGTMGSLLVYSGWDGLETLDSEHPKHTSYTVRSERGTKVSRVRNRCGSFEGDPQVVNLAPGRYWIEADATNVGLIQVPAMIRAGETTILYLDGITQPAAPWAAGTNWIRQASGLILGWRDTANQVTPERTLSGY